MTVEDRAGDHDLLAIYDDALPAVYGYLLQRCRDRALAEDLTADTFLAAVAAVRGERPPAVSVPWLVTVARNKLVDHWRRTAREQSALTALAGESLGETWQADLDGSDADLDGSDADDVLAALPAPYRTALTLRYVDGLSVPEVARLLGRTRHATEAVIVRARAAFRRAYEEAGDRDA